MTEPGYHELALARTMVETGAEEERLSDSSSVRRRGSSETGLAPWTPFPVIQSGGGSLPTLNFSSCCQIGSGGFGLPGDRLGAEGRGQAARVNGMVTTEGFSAFQLRRGFGSAIVSGLTSSNAAAVYAAKVGGLEARQELTVEPDPAWTAVSGELSGVQSWPDNSRILVVSNLVLTADSVLTVGSGSILKLAPGVEIIVSGKFIVQGARENPVLFTPETRNTPWGGLVLRAASAELSMTGAILTGSGANPDWFDANPGSGSSHREEQPLIYLSNGARAALTNCYLVHNIGQAAHGEDAFLTMTGCLVQRCISVGQFNGGSVNLRDSAFIEFPADDGVFADLDNDALYFTDGTHSLTNCLVGWAKDDGIDSGSGGAGESP